MTSHISRLPDGTIIIKGVAGSFIGKLIESERQTLISEFIEDLEWVITKAISHDTRERIKFKIEDYKKRLKE